MDDSTSEHTYESDVEIVDLDTPASRPRARLLPARLPERRWQVFFTVGLVVLTLVVIFASNAPTRNVFGGVLTGFFPTPTPTLVPGSDRFYIQGVPSWGQLLIDGKLIASPPSGNSSAKPLQLARGQHALTWVPRASYPLSFAPQRCTISVPPDEKHDSCHYTADYNGSSPPPWIVSIIAPFPSLAQLPTDQRQAILAAVRAALDANASTTIVQPGEPYATSASMQQAYAIAQEPLTARLHYLLDTDASNEYGCSSSGVNSTTGCFMNGQDCHQFCTVFNPWQYTSPEDMWSVLAVVRTVWDYTKRDGTVITRDQQDTSIVRVAGSDGSPPGMGHLTSMLLQWRGDHWQVSVMFPAHDQVLEGAMSSVPDPVCVSAWDDVAGGPTQLPTDVTPSTLNWNFVNRQPYADGCLAVTSSSYSRSYQPAIFLHRFGVLLAVNSAAQQQWPQLPVADEATRNIVQQLLTELQSLSGDPSIPSLSS